MKLADELLQTRGKKFPEPDVSQIPEAVASNIRLDALERWRTIRNKIIIANAKGQNPIQIVILNDFSHHSKYSRLLVNELKELSNIEGLGVEEKQVNSDLVLEFILGS